jgi:hypothetical protein
VTPDPKSNVVAVQHLREDLWRDCSQMGLKATM